MEKTLFEKMGGTYTQVGYYLFPDVKLPNEKPIGVWGQRHHEHLRKTNRVLFSQLVISGKMNDYLADIDKQAQELFEQLIMQMAKAEGITEQLKADNQMLWVGRLENIQNRAMEIVNNELIFDP